ncbi:MAG: AsmA family protein [Alphaproteobacteria bacterium]
MRVRKSIFFPIVRILGLFVIGLVIAIVVAFSQINLESLRGNLLTILRDATGMPVEIDGAVSWKFSLRPRVELNQVRIANESWAKNKYAFSAEKIDVRLNLISLFRDRPTIQNVKVYDAKINLEKNSAGKYSVASLSKKDDAEKVANGTIEKYPFKDAGLGGFEIKNLSANILGEKYSLAGFHIRLMSHKKGREYSGWVKADKNVLPFIVQFSEYNPERKVYPVQIALSTGDDALIANVALEGTSKAPIDFIVRGDVEKPQNIAEIFGLDLSGLPSLKLNVAGGFDWKKIMLRKSSVNVDGTEFTVSGTWDWSVPGGVVNADVYSPKVDLLRLFPGLYADDRKKLDRELNVFKDIPLFGDVAYGRQAKIHVKFGDLVVYRDLNIQDVDLSLGLLDNHARIDLKASIAEGGVDVGIDADIEQDGQIKLQAAAIGERIYVGEILKEVHKTDFLSELPVNFEFYVQANGKNLSQIMQTITGPIYVYSVAPGYAHSALVSYMYGTDFLTSLRHSVQDLFSSKKKYNQIKISCVAVNAKLRDGVIETQNGVAIETNAINVRLAGMLDLGGEEMKLALTTVPVRGIKLSLTGNVVNSIELTGNLAEPTVRISGAAVAGKVASATGLGLLLAPFTGGIGLVAGTGIGLVAGDLLENWLADGEPCETAMKRGAPLYRDDPEWMGTPMAELVSLVLKKE